MKKILDPTEAPALDTSVIQPVASRYTDFTILVPLKYTTEKFLQH
jgi:hypothetical protein